MKQFLPAILLMIICAVYQDMHAQDTVVLKAKPVEEEDWGPPSPPFYIVPEHHGGEANWQRFINMLLVYPKRAKKYGIEGKVTVQFIIDREGHVIDAWPLDGNIYLLQSAVNVVMRSPKLYAAVENGRYVKGYKKTVVEFKLDEDIKVGSEDRPRPHFEGEFPGGDSAWEQFIERNLVYSKEAMGRSVKAHVTIGFVLNKFGYVMDVIPVEGPPALLQSAMDVVCRSPKWSPAKKGGRRVKVYKKRVITFKRDK